MHVERNLALCPEGFLALELVGFFRKVCAVSLRRSLPFASLQNRVTIHCLAAEYCGFVLELLKAMVRDIEVIHDPLSSYNRPLSLLMEIR